MGFLHCSTCELVTACRPWLADKQFIPELFQISKLCSFRHKKISMIHLPCKVFQLGVCYVLIRMKRFRWSLRSKRWLFSSSASWRAEDSECPPCWEKLLWTSGDCCHLLLLPWALAMVSQSAHVSENTTVMKNNIKAIKISVFKFCFNKVSKWSLTDKS